MRGAIRDLILDQDWGRPISESIESLDVRLMFREGTKAPLGDFPDIEEGGLAMSQSALDVLWDDIEVFFDKIPIRITGAGVIKKSGIWYEVSLADLPGIPDQKNPYFYLHPARSLQREFEGPTECPPYESKDLWGVEIDQVQLEAKIKKARDEYLGPLGELEADVGAYDVGSIFVSGNLAGGFKNHVGIFFADKFIETCKRHKLKMMRLLEVTNDANS
jgi:hypothetical protein